MRREQDELPQLFLDPVVRIVLNEEAPQALFRNIGFYRPRVFSFSRGGERSVVNIACKDLHDRMYAAARRLFEQQNADAVSLLSRRATDDPDPNWRVVVEPVEQGLDRLLGERRKSLRVAEERRNGNQQVREKFVDLVLVVLKIMVVARKAFLPDDLHASREPAHDRRPLVLGKIMACAPAQQGDDLHQALFFIFPALVADGHLAFHDFANAFRQRGDGADEVDYASGDRALRHHRIFGFRRRLRENHAARLLDGANAARAVRTRAAQQDGDAVAPAGRDGLEKHIDGRAPSLRASEGARGHVIAVDHQFAVGRNHIDAIRLQPCRVFDLMHRHSRLRRENFTERTWMMRVEMNDDDIGEAQVAFDMGEERLQRGDASR